MKPSIRKRKDVVYRSWRGDLFVHRMTRNMSPLAYCVMFAAVAENLLGILKESPRLMSRRFANTTEADVCQAIDELVSRDNAIWWHDDETLWLVNALDEQANNMSCYKSAARHALTLPEHIRTAVIDRYRVLDTLSDTVCDTVSDTLFAQEQDQDQKQEKDQATSDRILDYLNAARSEFVPGSRLKDASQILGRLKDGRTEDECRLVVDGCAAACRRDRSKNLEWFDTITPFRKNNFERSLARAQAITSAPAPGGPSMDDLE